MSAQDEELQLNTATRSALSRLRADQRQRLETLIQNAARQQRQRIERALDEAVDVIPKPLRRRMQKLFGG